MKNILLNKREMIVLEIAFVFNIISFFLHAVGYFPTSTLGATIGTLSWMSSLFILGFIFLRNSKEEQGNNLNKKEKIYLLLFLLIAFIIRISFIKVESFKLDEWYWITNAMDILKHIVRSPFSFIGDQPSNLPAYPVALFYALTHDVYLSVRLPGIFYSLGTIVFVFLFVKDVINKKAAFFSALFLTISIWDIHMSISGFENITITPFIIAGTLYFLYKSLSTYSIKYIFLCGLFLGLSINLLYIASMSGIVVLLSFIRIWLIEKHKQQLIFPTVVLLITVFFTISPTIAKIIRYPDRTLQRHEQFLEKNIENSQKLSVIYYFNQLKLGVSDMGYSPKKYTIRGLWGITLEPMILFFFIIGFLYVIYRCLELPYFLVILSYLVMFIPIVLVYRFTSVWREYGFLPSIYIIAAIGISKTFALFDKKRLFKDITLILIVIGLLVSWLFSFKTYIFLFTSNAKNTYEYFCRDTALKIETTVPRNDSLYFPSGLCSKLTTSNLTKPYKYMSYKSLNDLHLKDKNRNKAIILYMYDPLGKPLSPSSVENSFQYFHIHYNPVHIFYKEHLFAVIFIFDSE